MKIHFACLLLLALIAVIVEAQYTTQGAFTLFGSSNNERMFAHCVDGSGSGSIFVTGSTDGSALGQQGGGGWDWFVAKYNRNNGFLSANANNPVVRWLQTPQEDIGIACASDVQGAVYIVGTTKGRLDNTTGFASERDVVVAKYDANMNRVWIRQFDVNAQSDSVPSKIVVFGSTLYIAGSANSRAFMHTMEASTGAQIVSTSIPAVGSSAYVADLVVDLQGVAIVAGVHQGYFAGTINSYGETIVATPVVSTYYAGFIMGFYPNGERKFQSSFGQTPRENTIITVAVDVNNSIYVGGSTSGSVNGADYQPASVNNQLVIFAKYNSYGVNLWTRIVGQTDNTEIRQIVVDNIGGLFMLKTRADCSIVPYKPEPSSSPYSCTNSESQYINLLKADTNGAIQWDVRVSSGIPRSTSLDNTGVLTIAGIIGNSNQLHGVAPNAIDGFVDQITINYNCSCGNLGQLVQEMTQLLNIVPQ